MIDPSSPTAVQSGLIEKGSKGFFGTKFKKQYFVLDGDKNSLFFGKDADHVYKKNEISLLSVKNATINGTKIRLNYKKRGHVALRAPTSVQAADWLNAIQSIIEVSTQKPGAVADLEYFLFLGGNVDTGEELNIETGKVISKAKKAVSNDPDGVDLSCFLELGGKLDKFGKIISLT